MLPPPVLPFPINARVREVNIKFLIIVYDKVYKKSMRNKCDGRRYSDIDNAISAEIWYSIR